jgi:Domain of unknown function (DUF4394)
MSFFPKARALAMAASGLTCAIGGTAAHAETLLGLTVTNQLLTFDSSNPTQGATPINISGLAFSERLLGIDLRPSTGVVYGLGSLNNLYTLDIGTGVATRVASLVADASDTSSPFSGLRGTAFGVDFNPVPDLGQTLPSLRITSNVGENLRINVNGSNAGKVFTDTDLNFTVGAGAPTLVASAYTNSDRDPATGTALYGIDLNSASLYLQTVPNNGALDRVGALGTDTIGVTGFDVSATGMAYASLTDRFTGASSLYAISLQGSGNLATSLGALGVAGNAAALPALNGLTALAAPVPEPASWAMALAGVAGLMVAGRASRRRQPHAMSRAG